MEALARRCDSSQLQLHPAVLVAARTFLRMPDAHLIIIVQCMITLRRSLKGIGCS